VSLDDLLDGLDLSRGPKSVEVHVIPGDGQRAAVVVSSWCCTACVAHVPNEAGLTAAICSNLAEPSNHTAGSILKYLLAEQQRSACMSWA
jgi:hypothetical protein